ncbi:imidazole glycerol phosphate synthase subunit HisH [Enteractinococcus coprophilus]|uniref:Imidazole glycerol phosphate synthase subunit HisH n=1 Tax=Enteractinococcus coprophilus TaxID=1027633 RepID=A0A543AK05_9MICC|nr:imidazole glycerol phosphate synthase subunit HisH [Enteractinococcus coprophilus]TQL72917.1 glutamine amidotransferase [Enteractinococcus coprophilus]
MSQANPVVAVADYGIGNLGSLVNALEYVGADVLVTSQGQSLLAADGMILPGNGAFGASKKAMERLSIPRWVGQRVAGGRPVLGICVGHQYLFDSSEEFGNHDGMGEWPGTVKKLPTDAVPHIGWSEVRPAIDSTLFAGLENERYYFSHSYAVLDWEFDQSIESMVPPQVSWGHHNGDFIAAVENGPLAGVQFHPELSGRAGLTVLQNWIGTF